MKDSDFREGYVIRDQFATHFLTFTVCGWIDLFTRKV
jgi:putative transposase